MIDVLLNSIVQRITDPLWRLAVVFGAIAALFSVGLLIYVGSLVA